MSSSTASSLTAVSSSSLERLSPFDEEKLLRVRLAAVSRHAIYLPEGQPDTEDAWKNLLRTQNTLVTYRHTPTPHLVPIPM